MCCLLGLATWQVSEIRLHLNMFDDHKPFTGAVSEEVFQVKEAD